MWVPHEEHVKRTEYVRVVASYLLNKRVLFIIKWVLANGGQTLRNKLRDSIQYKSRRQEFQVELVKFSVVDFYQCDSWLTQGRAAAR